MGLDLASKRAGLRPGEIPLYASSRLLAGRWQFHAEHQRFRRSAGGATNALTQASYDALGRTTFKDLPNAALWEFDVANSYDLLGRVLSEASNSSGAKTYRYDAAGGTRFTFRDGFYP